MFHVKQFGEQMIKAVLFDFNGTLFQDGDINEITWQQTYEELTRNRLDFDTFYPTHKSIHSHIVIQEVLDMFEDLKNEDSNKWASIKEAKYRKYCIDHKRNQITPGAEKFLIYLKEKEIKRGLCTASIIENVNFYYSNLNLNRWFDMKYTVYDDGTYTSKMQMYLDCAKKLNIDIKDCLIIEDMPNPIKEAIKAGCKNIIAIKSDDTKNLDLPEIKQFINDFNDIDCSILD